MFSVVIPLYNKEISVKETLYSVLNQSFSDFEVIIVNDGSTDKSLEKVNEIADPRLRIINKKNGGVSSARNLGIKEANEDWIAFLDGDDFWKQDHLSTVANLIKEFPEDLAFCTSFVKNTDDAEEKKASINSVEIINDYFERATKKHFFWTSVVVLKKEIFNEIGFFNEKLALGEDLDVWSRVGRKYRIIKSNNITAIYNKTAENKATLREYSYEKSFLSTINLSGKTGNERKYLKKLLLVRLYWCAKVKNWSIGRRIIQKLININ